MAIPHPSLAAPSAAGLQPLLGWLCMHLTPETLSSWGRTALWPSIPWQTATLGRGTQLTSVFYICSLADSEALQEESDIHEIDPSMGSSAWDQDHWLVEELTLLEIISLVSYPRGGRLSPEMPSFSGQLSTLQ